MQYYVDMTQFGVFWKPIIGNKRQKCVETERKMSAINLNSVILKTDVWDNSTYAINQHCSMTGLIWVYSTHTLSW